MPVALVWVTLMTTAGWPAPSTSRDGLLRSLMQAVFLGVVLAAILATTTLVVGASTRNRTGLRAGPAPRWQYLLGSVVWLGAAACFALAGQDGGHGWGARACFALGGWSAVFGLALLGRATCRGRVRQLFWWRQPPWITPGPPAPPAGPA